MKSASAVTDDQVSDSKIVQAMAKSMQTVKPVSSRWAGAKMDLTGDASTSELEKAAGTLRDQTSKLKSKLKVLKADVLAVTPSQAHKLLSDAIGNGDKVLADADGKVPDGDQTRNDLIKALEGSTGQEVDSQGFSDAKTVLDAKVKAVQNPGRYQGCSGRCAGPGCCANVPSNVGGGYSAPARRGGNGSHTPSHNVGGNYREPSGRGNATASKGSNGGHPACQSTLDGTPAVDQWGGNQNNTEMEF